jgi:hypothetical protein
VRDLSILVPAAAPSPVFAFFIDAKEATAAYQGWLIEEEIK